MRDRLKKSKPREPVEHMLKIDEPYYQSILNGEKKFEIRFNDRNYQVGDTIVLHPFREGVKVNRAPIGARINYIHSGLGLQDGYVILGIEFIEN